MTEETINRCDNYERSTRVFIGPLVAPFNVCPVFTLKRKHIVFARRIRFCLFAHYYGYKIGTIFIGRSKIEPVNGLMISDGKIRARKERSRRVTDRDYIGSTKDSRYITRYKCNESKTSAFWFAGEREWFVRRADKVASASRSNDPQ